MDTFTRLRDIFFSGTHTFTGGDVESIQEIAFLIDEGYLDEKGIVIGKKSEYTSLLSQITELKKIDEASGGSFEHVALKLLSQKYLLERSIKSVFEHPFCGYYPDVISEDSKIVIECGNTQNAGKILTYFTQGRVTETIQVPYPDIDDENIMGYQFTPSKGLHEFLQFLEAEKRSDIKKILNHR